MNKSREKIVSLAALPLILLLSTLALTLSLLPVFLPYSLLLGGLALLLAALYLKLHRVGAVAISAGTLKDYLQVLLIKKRRIELTEDLESREVLLVIRAAALARLALILSLLFYTLLALHSWLFYILPFKSELAPFQESFQERGQRILEEEDSNGEAVEKGSDNQTDR